jgi:hypothetical protein
MGGGGSGCAVEKRRRGRGHDGGDCGWPGSDGNGWLPIVCASGRRWGGGWSGTGRGGKTDRWVGPGEWAPATVSGQNLNQFK